MSRAICLLLFTLVLAIMPVTAEDEACQDGATKVPQFADVILVANVTPCGWLLTFPAGKIRDYELIPLNDSLGLGVYPSDTSCLYWRDLQKWGVTAIRVVREGCTVFVRALGGDSFSAKLRRYNK